MPPRPIPYYSEAPKCWEQSESRLLAVLVSVAVCLVLAVTHIRSMADGASLRSSVVTSMQDPASGLMAISGANSSLRTRPLMASGLTAVPAAAAEAATAGIASVAETPTIDVQAGGSGSDSGGGATTDGGALPAVTAASKAPSVLEMLAGAELSGAVQIHPSLFGRSGSGRGAGGGSDRGGESSAADAAGSSGPIPAPAQPPATSAGVTTETAVEVAAAAAAAAAATDAEGAAPASSAVGEVGGGGQASRVVAGLSGEHQQGQVAPSVGLSAGGSAEQQPHRHPLQQREPYGIAHRGASAELPEHTREAYELAVAEGADFIECDVVLTSDLVPLCRHEPNLIDSTDAAAKFPDRWRNYTIDGENVTGIFSVDLTGTEVATLRAVQPWPFRNQSYNGLFKVATLADYLDVALSANRSVGIYPETKHPSWTNALSAVRAANTRLEDILLAALAAAGFTGAQGSAEWRRRPVFLQSFEATSLRYLAQHTCVPMVLLLGDWEGWVTPDSGMTLQEVTADASLGQIARWAAAVGPAKGTLVSWRQEEGEGGGGSYVSSGLMERFRSHGLQVHTYTLRPEPRFFLPHLAESSSTAAGTTVSVNVSAEYDLLLGGAVAADGVFADHMPSYKEWLQHRQQQQQQQQQQGKQAHGGGGGWQAALGRVFGGSGAVSEGPGRASRRAKWWQTWHAAQARAQGDGGGHGAAATSAAGIGSGSRLVTRRAATEGPAAGHERTGGAGGIEVGAGAAGGGRVWSDELRCHVYRPSEP